MCSYVINCINSSANLLACVGCSLRLLHVQGGGGGGGGGGGRGVGRGWGPSVIIGRAINGNVIIPHTEAYPSCMKHTLLPVLGGGGGGHAPLPLCLLPLATPLWQDG